MPFGIFFLACILETSGIKLDRLHYWYGWLILVKYLFLTHHSNLDQEHTYPQNQG